MNPIPAAQISLRDACAVVLRHKYKAGGVFLLILTASVLVTLLSSKVYQSQSLLYVRLGRENIGLDPTTTIGQPPVFAIPGERENEINTVVEVLLSRALAEKVVDALGTDVILSESPELLGLPAVLSRPVRAAEPGAPAQEQESWLARLGVSTPLSARERAIVRLQRNFAAEALRKTDMVAVTYKAADPEVARQILGAYSELYFAEHLRLNRVAGSHDFLERQVHQLLADLSETEEDLKLRKNEGELAAPQVQGELLVTRIAALHDEMLAVEALEAATRAEVEALRGELAGLPEQQVTAQTTGLDNHAADGIRQQLFTLQAREQDLRSKLTDEHYELKMVREQLARLHAIYKEEEGWRTTTTVGPNRAYEETRLALLRQEPVLASLQSKSEVLRRQMAGLRSRLQTHTDSELQVARLQRKVELQDASFRKYHDSLEQARIDHELATQRISNINVVQAPSYAEKPIRPRKLLNLAAGLLGGLIAGLGIAFLAESLDQSLKAPEQVEQVLGLPTLASIPQLARRHTMLAGKNGT